MRTKRSLLVKRDTGNIAIRVTTIQKAQSKKQQALGRVHESGEWKETG